MSERIEALMSLEELCEQGRRQSLLEAIAVHDIARVTKILFDIKEPLPVAIVQELARMISPDRKPCNMGPKEHKREYNLRCYALSIEYETLSRDKEFARYLLNPENPAFDVEDGEPIHDDNGTFAPVWKFPDLIRARNSVDLPDAGALKTWMCSRRNISESTLNPMLAAGNKLRKRRRS